MSYLLAGTTIPGPNQMGETNSTQVAQQRTLGGSVNRDHFGSNKRKWVLKYRNKLKADYDTLKTIYDSYLSTTDVKTWQVTETNYTIAETNVHVDLVEREFNVGGENYISGFDLILTES